MKKRDLWIIGLAVVVLAVVVGVAARISPVGAQGCPPDCATGPTVEISVTPSTISPGQTATLSWYATNATKVAYSSFGATDTYGSITVSPDRTTEYDIEVQDDNYMTAYTSTLLTVAIYQPMNIIDETNPTYIGPGGNRSDYNCPVGTAACGMMSQVSNNYQQVELACCSLTSAAVSKGVSIGSGAYHIDSGNSDSPGDSLYCTPPDVLVGGEWAKNGQLDFGTCAHTAGFILNGSQEVTTWTPGVTAFCPNGTVANGCQYQDGKNDACRALYCATTAVNVYVPPPLTFGTIQVNSVDASTGASVSASWSFTGPSGGPCESTSCSGTGGTYNNEPTGGYSLVPDSSSVPSGYTGAYTILLNNQPTSTCASSPNSCAGTLTNGDTLTFTIKWQPVEPAIAASWDNTYWVTSTSITLPPGSDLDLTDYIRNIGAVGSSLFWKCNLQQMPPGYTGNNFDENPCELGQPLNGGAQKFQGEP